MHTDPANGKPDPTPLVSLGQGDYRRDYTPGDCERAAANALASISALDGALATLSADIAAVSKSLPAPDIDIRAERAVRVARASVLRLIGWLAEAAMALDSDSDEIADGKDSLLAVANSMGAVVCEYGEAMALTRRIEDGIGGAS